MELVRCPDTSCTGPAEVVDRWRLASTDGPADHVRTRCLHRHIFTVLVERLPSMDGG